MLNIDPNERICLSLKHRPYYFDCYHQKPLPLLASLASAIHDQLSDFPLSCAAYISDLKQTANPLAKRYLGHYNRQHKKAYTLNAQLLSQVDLALLTCHFNFKLAFFIPKSDSQKENKRDCRLTLLTSYTIESFLPPFTFENQLSESEQFSLLSLGPCRYTLCLLCDTLDEKNIIHGPFLSLRLQKGSLPL